MKCLILSAIGEVCHIQVTEYHFQICLKNNTRFLGMFALRKATISFVMSVWLSTRNNSALTGQIFMKFDI